MISMKRKTQARSKLLAVEGPSIKRMTYVFSLASISFNFFGVRIYEQGTYLWYEGHTPMLLVIVGLIFATVNFIVNSSLFIMETAVNGRISKWRMFLVYSPFIFMFINLIRYPALYSIPIVGTLYFLVSRITVRKKTKS